MLKDVRIRLAGMMFLLYFSIGSWAVTLSSYLLAPAAEGGLNFSPGQVSWAYTTYALGGMLAPLVAGPLADRWFRADRVVLVAAIGGAAVLALTAVWCDGRADAVRAAAEGPGREAAVRLTFAGLVVLLAAYCFFLQLVQTLANVITHRNHPAGAAGYAHMRLFGTVGWVVAGNLIALLLVAVSAQPLWLAAGSTALFALSTLTLPPTPPLSHDRRLMPALRLLRNPTFNVFLAACFLSAAANQFYAVYIHRALTDLGVSLPERLMTVAQVLEVGCMAAIPWLKPVRNMKLLMLLGLGGYLLRAVALCGWSKLWVVALAVPLHGWSFAFFFVVAQTYLKRVSTPDIAAGAQAILTFVAGGVGVCGGNLLAGWVVGGHRVGTVTDWPAVWLVPLVGCAAAFALFLVAFRQPRTLAVEGEPAGGESAAYNSGSPSPTGVLA